MSDREELLNTYTASLRRLLAAGEWRAPAAASPEAEALNAALGSLAEELGQARSCAAAARSLLEEDAEAGDAGADLRALGERLRAYAERLRQQARDGQFYSSLVHIAPDGILFMDLSGSIRYISEKGASMFGYPEPRELLGSNMYDFVAPEYRDKAANLLGELLRGNYTGVGEYQVLHRNGHRFWTESNAEVVKDEAGNPTGILLVFRDSSEKKRMEHQLLEYMGSVERLARTDRMTGLLNRAEGLDSLVREVRAAERHGEPVTVCFLDMDGLKLVNDEAGHEEGDRMILALTACIQAHVRQADLVCRMGGDEFLLVFPNTPEAAARAVVRRIADAAARAGAEQGLVSPLSFSYGVVPFEAASGLDAEALVRLADDAMYKQKKEKRQARQP